MIFLLYACKARTQFKPTDQAKILCTSSHVQLVVLVSCRMRYGSQLEQQVQLELMEANKQAAEEFLM
jgi:hypothetical protein